MLGALVPGGALHIALNDHSAAGLGNVFTHYAELGSHFQWDYVPLDDLQTHLECRGNVDVSPYAYQVKYDTKESLADAILTAVLDLGDSELIAREHPDTLEYAEKFRTNHGDYCINVHARIISVQPRR